MMFLALKPKAYPVGYLLSRVDVVISQIQVVVKCFTLQIKTLT